MSGYITHHSNKKPGADIDRRTCRRIGHRRDDSRKDTHDSIASNCNAIARSSVSRGEDFWCIRIQAAIVDVEAETDSGSKAEILRRSADSSVCKEEGHSQKCANDHGIAPPEESVVAHETCQNGSENATDGRDHVVPPFIVRTGLSCGGAAAL